MLTLETTLTNRNASATLEAGLNRLSQGDLTVDCAPLTQVDSAAIAVLLGWQRAAQAQQRKVIIHHAPPQLISLATVYGVEPLLAFAK
jgi:phospholipid transport system transporter-binding protein